MTVTRPVILTVEDDAGIQDLLGMILELEGYAVETATSGADALECLDAGEVDLALVDLTLPDMDGVDLCHRVRTHPINTDVPIVVLSAARGDQHRERSLAAGATDYVVKPFDLDNLLHVVATHLDGRSNCSR
jgi:DNA-binding response OmpR family regulator